MVLNEEQLKEILIIIEDYSNSFIYNNVTADLPDVVIAQLKERGLIDPLLDQDEFFKKTYELSRLKALTEDLPDKINTYNQLKRHLMTNPVAKTDFEVAAIDHLTSTAKKYLEKHTEWLKTAVDEVVRNQNMALRHDIISGDVKTVIARGFAERKGITQIVSDVRDLGEDVFRDWHRVVQTELQNAINVGQVDNIISRNPDKTAKELFVYKRPNPDRCKFCESAYLENDKSTPRIFKLSALLANGTNYGKKARNWLPVHEVHHVWCQCRLYQVEEGWGFQDGKLHFFGENHDTSAFVSDASKLEKSHCTCDTDLEKAQTGHKYIKREGSPGHYKYFYDEGFTQKISGEKKLLDKIKVAVKQHMLYHDKKEIKHDEIYDIIGHLFKEGHIDSKTPISVLTSLVKKKVEGAEKRGRGRPRKEEIEDKPEKPIDTSNIPGTPRNEAKNETKKALEDKDEYLYARESEVGNKGEDLLGSARHKRNSWKGIEGAENSGNAAELVTRDKLLKNEPIDLFKAAEKMPFGAIVSYYAMQKFPKAPDTKDIDEIATYYRYKKGATTYVRKVDNINIDVDDPNIDVLKKMSGKEYKREVRSQYYDAYKRISKKAVEIAEKSEMVDLILDTLKFESKDIIKELRQSNYYNPLANQFAKYHNNVLKTKTWGGVLKQTVLGSNQDFHMALEKKYQAQAREEFGDKAEFKDVKQPTDDEVKEYVKQILEGKKLSDVFDLEKKDKEKGFSAAEQYVDSAERKGPPTHIKSEKRQENYILNKAKMRGLQWGNSVTDEERAHHMQFISDSFKDLTDILGLPDEMGSFNGKLGLAVGARGHGTALAHYEPEMQVINLTRKGGVGSLAHEWGHFFDNVVGKTVLDEDKDFSNWAASVSLRSKKSSSRVYGSNSLFEENRGYVKKDPNTREYKSAKSNLSEEALNIGKSFTDLREELHSFRDKMMKTSSFHKLSSGKKNYWSSTIEVFARSFEKYIQNKLEKNGRKNTYLVGVMGHEFWPDSDDVKKMEPHFDKLFETFKNSSYLKKAIDYLDDLQKGRESLPIGTIHNKYKKVAEGKWVPVKPGRRNKPIDDRTEKKTIIPEIKKIIDQKKQEFGGVGGPKRDAMVKQKSQEIKEAFGAKKEKTNKKFKHEAGGGVDSLDGKVSINEYGINFKTGKPVKFSFGRNIKSSGKSPPGDPFQQKIEPSGRFMLHVKKEHRLDASTGWIYGDVTFKKPIVLQLNTGDGIYNDNSWKMRLSRAYGNKKGQKLSKAIAKAGYDGIVTVNEHGTSEIVDLRFLHTGKIEKSTEDMIDDLLKNNKD